MYISGVQNMESMPKVIAAIEDEIAKIETMRSTSSDKAFANIASEQAGLKKLLAFSKEIAGIQARFETKS